MGSITRFKIFGERHTATNALSAFLTQNFSLPSLYYDYLGWKHRLAPKKEEWEKFNPAQTLFIFTIRNPYTWLKAMHREPYYYHQPQIVKLTFREFILHSVEDYENYIKMWNLKNLSYLRMSNEVPNALVVRMEDFLLEQQELHERVGTLVQNNEEFRPFDKYVSGYGVDENKALSHITELPPVPDLTYEIINAQLDKSLMETFGYDYAYSSQG